MGKPITMVNKMAESVLTQEPQNASSLTQVPYWSLLQDKLATMIELNRNCVNPPTILGQGAFLERRADSPSYCFFEK